MQLIRYNPYRMQNSRHNTTASFFDELFDDFFSPAMHSTWPAVRSARQNLQVDIYEKENSIVIEAEMPGVAKEDIELDVKGRQLTLSGERKQQNEVKNEHSYRKERRYGRFERSFNLPFEIDAENVQATLNNGVLQLIIEKPAQQQRKQITIN